MKGYRIFKVLKVLLMVCVAVLVFGFVTMSLWNALVPAIFGLKAITFLQALGLLVLGKILFGGFHRHGCGGPGWKRGWRGQWEERWAKMTPEEREKFRAGMRGRRGCGWDVPSEPASEQSSH
jgi:hypothetical protein